ncbi:hypothetical protein E4P42_00920 [Mycobacterium sp. PS03-16]|uniref:hypothetical protein n=1 Tax=Mycobacterium sp. PS03-16 TaxID=2559611 RepID=UPI001074456C|nr:hypothetical protein [Mycobacterium sp. PS03-16]TFV61492.1 hypothetical protein E4P42_00920 [Mycobacterium sp. PS03-16]
MPTIEVAHPPQALLSAINPTLRLALRTPLGGALKDFMVVGFTGRKTGRRFAVPVSAHLIDGNLHVILEAGWKHNFRDGAPAEITYRGKTASMQGQLISDPDTVADLVHRAAQGYGAKKAQRMMGFRFGGDTVPSLADFTEAAKRLKIAAIRLTPEI